MYQALYRKWRPRTFDDVVGQTQITETLKHQVSSGAVSHAYLFIGTRGTGKTTCAKILARAINCESPVNGNPCNHCKSCLGIENGTILDVEELDAASNNGVDNVRALRDEAVYSPAEVRKRVYIIDEVHMLSVSAFNALLKILEEPPEHLVFILATTELHKVPATILSRCQRYSFKRLPPETVAERLRYVAEQENLELTPEASEMLGRLAEGSMRDGLSILDQCAGRGKIDEALVRAAMGLAGGARTAELLEAVAAGDTAQALSRFASLWQDGKDPATLLGELSALERDALILSAAPKGGAALLSGSYDTETLKRVQRAFTPARLMSDLEKLQKTLADLRNVQNPRTAAELCLISMCEPSAVGSLSELTSRVERLERGAVPAAAPAQNVPQRVQTPAASAETPVPAAKSAPERAEIPPERSVPENGHVPEEAPVRPVQEPEKTERPAPEAAKRSASDADGAVLWAKVLEKAQSGMSIGTFSMASDSASVGGVIRDDLLTVQYRTPFAKMMLDKPELLELLRAAAETVTGRKMRVRAEEAAADAPAAVQEDKLSKLERFGVTFE